MPLIQSNSMLHCTIFKQLFIDDGRLFTWGWNEHGMCATGDEDNVERPTIVKALSDLLAVDCASGAGHCLVLCKDKT